MAKTTKAQQAAARRYVETHLSRIALDIPKETAAAFRAKCEQEGVSMRSVLLDAIERFLATG